MTKRFPFTPHLYEFLEEAGYTHILLRGIEQTGDAVIKPDADFLLIPWKEEMEMETAADVEKKNITDYGVRSMIGAAKETNYRVELPETLAGVYELKIQIDEQD